MIDADGEDLSYFTFKAADAQGHWQPHEDREIQFAISGSGLIAAVGNGDAQDPALYHGVCIMAIDAICIRGARVVARASKQSGYIALTARTIDLSDDVITIQAKAGESNARNPTVTRPLRAKISAER